MTDQSSVFADPQTETTPPENTNQEAPKEDKSEDRLSVLEKRFNDSQQFIEQLKSENSQMREELDKRVTAEQVLEQVKSNKEEGAAHTAQPELDMDSIGNLVKNTVTETLSETKLKEEQSKNVTSFRNALVEKYGDKAEEVYRQHAQETGLSVSQLDSIVSSSSKAALKLFGLQKETNKGVTVQTGFYNTQTFDELAPTQTVKPGSYAFYEKMRKENPSLYFKPSTQNKMAKEALEKGAAFYQ